MNGFVRYALYMVPAGEFYRKGADWLGWDSALGQAAMQPALAGLPQDAHAITATPRKYGLHATIKPPFRLAPGCDATGLDKAARDVCAALAPVTLPALIIARLGSFIAAVPAQPSPDLQHLAAETVAAFEPFRAALTEVELARRRKSRLTPRQEALLTQWGYPYVMEEFRFHITLSGALPEPEAERTREILAAHFAPVLPEPFIIDSLCLMGEDQEGLFHLIHRYRLSG
jgi:putative phosphonate metabolism protein